MRIKIINETKLVGVKYIPLSSLNEWIAEELANAKHGRYKIKESYGKDKDDFNSKGYMECLFNLRDEIADAVYEEAD